MTELIIKPGKTDEPRKEVTGKVCILQSDQYLLVGQTKPSNLNVVTDPDNDFPNSHDAYLYDVGVLMVQRGTVPGKVHGSLINLKILSIGSLNFCDGPMTKIKIPDQFGLYYCEDQIPENDKKILRGEYEKFINREPSQVTLERAHPEVP